MNGRSGVMGSTKRIVMKARDEGLYFLSSWFILLPRIGVLSAGAEFTELVQGMPASTEFGHPLSSMVAMWLPCIGLPALFRSFFHLSSIDER